MVLSAFAESAPTSSEGVAGSPGGDPLALHNFCIWLNEQLDRPRLAFANLLGW